MTTLQDRRAKPSRLGIGAGIAAVLVVLLGVFLIQSTLRGDGDRAASGDSSSSAAPSTAGSFDETAQQAANGGFPVMIPAEVPAGWSIGSWAYAADQSWHFAATAPSGGTVSVDQQDLTPAELVDAVIGSVTPAGQVDMTKWGTGTWDAFEYDGGFAVATQLPSTSVMVSGANRDDVIELTKQLLTAEPVAGETEG